MKVVLSLGGSLLTRELTGENFKKYVDAVLKLKEDGHRLIVVCGGGKTCRDYQKIARPLGAGRDELDFIGIMATHLNAAAFCFSLGGNGHLVKWNSLEGAGEDVRKNFGKGVVVAAGYDVGTSTDYDAAYFAQTVEADLLVNATNIDGIYDSDPKTDKGAKKFNRMSHDQFIGIVKSNVQAPGEYRLFDMKAAKLIKKLGLKMVSIDGNDPEEILKAVSGGHSGTEVS